MRLTLGGALALVLLAGCNLPCRDRAIAEVAAGGPIGILVAALDQCHDEPLPPPSVVPTEGLQVQLPDLAESPADMASPTTPDLAHPRDMTPPPDLTPPPPVVIVTMTTSWQASGSVVPTAPDAGHVSAGYDFVRFKPQPGIFEAVVTLPPQAAQAKKISLTYTVSASANWAATTCTVVGSGPGYTVAGSGTSTCLEPQWWAGWSVDGSAAQGPSYLSCQSTGSIAPSISGKTPFGTYLLAETGQSIKLHLEVDGTVDIKSLTGVVTTTLTF